MGKFTAAFLLVLFIQPVFADAFTADTVCTWTPWNNSYYDRNYNWQSECDGQPVTGIALCSSQSGVLGDVSKSQPTIDTSENRDSNNIHCWCKMTAPYEGVWVYHGSHTYAEKYCSGSGSGAMFSEICAARCAELWLVKNSGNDWLDHYSNGYRGTAEELAAIKAGLFTPVGVETPCEIGISKLMVSTGDSFSLWAEKYTEPSLVVEYNNQKCYGKLESGTGTLNIQFDGAVYHVVN